MPKREVPKCPSHGTRMREYPSGGWYCARRVKGGYCPEKLSAAEGPPPKPLTEKQETAARLAKYQRKPVKVEEAPMLLPEEDDDWISGATLLGL